MSFFFLNRFNKVYLNFLLFFFFAMLFSFPFANAVVPSEPISRPNESLWREISSIDIPESKPDPTIFMLSIPTDTEAPILRPEISEFFPEAKRYLTEMVFNKTNMLSKRDDIIKLQLNKNEGINPLLKRAGFSSVEAHNAVVSLSKITNLKKLPIGLEVQSLVPKENRPGGITFRISKDFNAYAIRNKNGKWSAIKARRPMITETITSSGVINSSLYLSAVEANLPEDALIEFVQLMGYSVDFQREIQPGDSFRVLFKQSFDVLDEKRIGLENLIYAELNLSGKSFIFYRYAHKDGKVGYYDKNGHSAKKTLMKTPINGARLSSGFGIRKHPIKNYSAMHKGLDFAAPYGTPIYAAGDGVLEKVGWLNGYGRYILIRHNSTYKTAYAHLNGWAKGIKRGVKVSQGQIIGYVGSSGNSTGPHLHYEVLINNMQKNPLRLKMPSGKPIPDDEMKDFKHLTNEIDTRLMKLLKI